MTVTICDVAPRDGLQNDPKILEPVTRAAVTIGTSFGRPFEGAIDPGLRRSVGA